MVIGRRALTLIYIGILAAGFSGVLAGQSHARTFSTATSFGFFAGTPDAFLGQVESNNKPNCRRHRLVKVFRTTGGGGRLVGRDRANATGQWEINLANVPAAHYYALVPRKTFGPRGRHTCRAYRSSTLSFGG